MARRDRLERLRLGDRAEAIVARHLEARGYRIVARNLRVGRDEIDIVAERGRTLAFCEVRSRSSDRGIHPLETIDRAKTKRIRRAAVRWLIEQGVRGKALRFDAAAVTFETPEGVVDYVEGAF